MTARALAASVDAGVMARWRTTSRDELAALGQRLRQLGLTEAAVSYCFGVRFSIHAPLRAHAIRGVQGMVPSALMAHLWVAGAAVPRARAQARLGGDIELLSELGLITCKRDTIRANVAILPVGEALVVSDRADLHRGRDIALFPDDSAFHTLGVVPPRASRAGLRWLDVGTGSALVPLARPGAAAHILGTDINPRAIAMAELGAAMSGVRHIELAVADLVGAGQETGPWDRITFNAPIPAGVQERGLPDTGQTREDAPWYRWGAPDILNRFWTEVRELVAPGGEVLVHSWLPDEGYPTSLDLPGSTIAMSYTPRGHTAFGITWWRPDGPSESRRISQELSEQIPHLNRTLLEQTAAQPDSR